MYNCNSMPKLGKGTLFWNVWFKFRPVGEWERGWIEMDLRWWLIVTPVSSVSARATPFLFSQALSKELERERISESFPRATLFWTIWSRSTIFTDTRNLSTLKQEGKIRISLIRITALVSRGQVADREEPEEEIQRPQGREVQGKQRVYHHGIYVSWPPPSCDTIWVCVGRGDLNGTQSRR